MTRLFDLVQIIYSASGGSFSAENFIYDQSVYARVSMNGPRKHDLFYWRTGVTNIRYCPAQPYYRLRYGERVPLACSLNIEHLSTNCCMYVLPLVQYVFYQTETLVWLYEAALIAEANYQITVFREICDLNNRIMESGGNSNTREIHNWGLRYEKNLRVDSLYKSHENSMNLILEKHSAENWTPNREPMAKIDSQTTMEGMRVILSTAEEYLSHRHDYKRSWRYVKFIENRFNMYHHLQTRDRLYSLRCPNKCAELQTSFIGRYRTIIRYKF